MRRLRTIFNHGMLVLGLVVIFGAIFMGGSIYSQLAIVLVGILCIEVSVWQLANRLFPSERRFHDLRQELDAFVSRCRQLNQAAVALKTEATPEHRAAFDDLHQALHQSVEVIAQVAGETPEDLALETREEMALRE